MIHDTSRGSKNNEAELTRRKQVVDPGFNILLLDVEAGRDDTTLVKTTNQLNDNLAGSVIINDFKFTNIT